MLRQIIVLFIVSVILAKSDALCPSYVRLANALVPNPVGLDLLINGQVITTNVPFRTISRYFALRPGNFVIDTRRTGTSTSTGSRTITGVPNSAYTVAITGPFTGPGSELIFNQSPFVFIENIFPPNKNSYKGTFHRLEESTSVRDFEIITDTYISGISDVVQKTVAYYSEQVPGPVTFNVLTSSGDILINRAGFPNQINTTVDAGTIFDLFIIGDDTNVISPTQLSTASYVPTVEPISGCILVDGSSIFPDSTPFTPFFSFQPCPPINSSSSIAIGVALFLVFVALLF